MRRKKGVFEVTVEGDLNGWSYLYELYVNGKAVIDSRSLCKSRYGKR